MNKWSSIHLFPVMSVSICLLVIWAGVLLARLQAQTPDVEASKAAVSRWLSDLTSNSRAVRSHAEAELIRLGPKTLESLPLPGAVTDPAIRESLDRIARSIDQAESESALRPQLVSWNGVQSWDEAFQRLHTQTRNFPTLPAQPLPIVTSPFPLTPLTFWQAVSWAESHSSLRYTAGHWMTTGDSSPNEAISDQGPFRIQLLDHTVRTTSSGSRLLRVQIRSICEPRLKPLFLMAAVDDWSVEYAGTTIRPFTPQARLEIPGGASGVIDVAYDFVIPVDIDGRDDWTIRGQVELTLAASSTFVTFSELKAKLPQSRRRGQASLSLLSVKSTDTTCSVRVASAFPEMSGLFESYRASLLAPELTLELPESESISPTEVTQIQEDPEGIVLESRFATSLPPEARLQARIPTAISTQKIPFHFPSVTLLPSPK